MQRHNHPFRPLIQAPPGRRRPRRGFTIVELLVVISIIVIGLAVTIPYLAKTASLGRGAAGRDAVAVAIPAAQAFARRDLLNAKFTTFDYDPIAAGVQNVCPAPGGTYSGAAILFTPSNELRLIENVPYLARNTDGAFLEYLGLNGYVDISGRDYITLPQGACVVGILRDSTGLILISPPFAVRFNPEGNLAFDAGNDAFLYYDGNADGKIQTTNQRVASYNPQAWDTRFSTVVRDTNTSAPLLPFEKIETVVGILLFLRADMDGANANLAAVPAANAAGNFPINANVTSWLLTTDSNGDLKNAQAVFFSRNGGTMMRRLP